MPSRKRKGRDMKARATARWATVCELGVNSLADAADHVRAQHEMGAELSTLQNESALSDDEKLLSDDGQLPSEPGEEFEALGSPFCVFDLSDEGDEADSDSDTLYVDTDEEEECLALRSRERLYEIDKANFFNKNYSPLVEPTEKPKKGKSRGSYQKDPKLQSVRTKQRKAKEASRFHDVDKHMIKLPVVPKPPKAPTTQPEISPSLSQVKLNRFFDPLPDDEDSSDDTDSDDDFQDGQVDDCNPSDEDLLDYKHNDHDDFIAGQQTATYFFPGFITDGDDVDLLNFGSDDFEDSEPEIEETKDTPEPESKQPEQTENKETANNQSTRRTLFGKKLSEEDAVERLLLLERDMDKRIRLNTSQPGDTSRVMRLHLLRMFFQYRLRTKLGKETCSKAVIKMYYYNVASVYKEKVLRKWAWQFQQTGQIPRSWKGCHPKRDSLITHEDVMVACLEWVRTDPENKDGVCLDKFRTYVSEKIIPNIVEGKLYGTEKAEAATNGGISERTAARWLAALGLNYDEKRKGVYFDGHERADVRQYRDVFIGRMFGYAKFMQMYEDYDVDVEIPLELFNGDTEFIWMTHDEACFWANDDKKRVWFEKGKPPPFKKDQGPSLMVSQYLNPKTGPVAFPQPKLVSAFESENVHRKFQLQMSNLAGSDDCRVKLLSSLMEAGFHWAGSSLVAYLTKGLPGLVALLDINNDDDTPTHDIDLYLTDASTKRLTDKSRLLTSAGWTVSVQNFKFVKKFSLVHTSGVRLEIDHVDCVKHKWHPGTDVGNLKVHVTKNAGYVADRFHDIAVAPPVELTLLNALELPLDKPLDCYVLRRDVMPNYDASGALVADDSLSSGDRKYRTKLHERKRNGEYNLVPVYDVRVIIKPGAGRDGYWQVQHMYAQLQDAITAFELTFPDEPGHKYRAVFVFDQSQNHLAFAPDALIVSNFNMKDGTKAKKPLPPARTGWYVDAATGDKVVQDMNVGGQRRGMLSILRERGLAVDGKKADCQHCKGEKKRGFAGEVDATRNDCCLRRMLANQPDFLEQRCMLQELVESRGHYFLKYPKFHCELNFIEMYWGAVKLRVRRLCDYSMKTLARNVPKFLDSVPLGLIRRFARKSWRYMDSYRQGATGRLAAFMSKKYAGHRCVPATWLAEVQEEYYTKYNERATESTRPEVAFTTPTAHTVAAAAVPAREVAVVVPVSDAVPVPVPVTAAVPAAVVVAPVADSPVAVRVVSVVVPVPDVAHISRSRRSRVVVRPRRA
jgi:hypothetical protein